MADTTYTDYVPPAVNAEWLNEINDHVWHDTPVTGTTVHDASVIKNTPSGNIIAVTIQAAINELDSEKLNTATLALSSGSSLVGFLQSGSGAVARTLQSKERESVCVDDFGAIGDDSTDDTTALNLAFASGAKHVTLSQGKIYRATALTIASSNFTLELPSGSGIRGTVATNKLITISGNECSIIGTGTIYGPAVFDGTNTQPTYALVWVTGNNLYCNGITIDTVPKEALMFEDSTGHRVEGCRFIGRYPYASYDENTTTNHCAIMSNIPASTTNAKPTLTIVGNYFESFIQGILTANYGAAGNNTGVTIVGNTFKDCWDHGVYMSRGLGHNISSNTFLSCRRPIVSDGIGCVVNGNVLYSAETGISNAQQAISVRESSYSTITNNSIYGVDASIYVDCIETVVTSGNIIANNILYSTGTVFTTAMIRVGVGATTNTNNVIRGNTLITTTLAATDPCIQVTMASGFGYGNEVSDNTVVRKNPGNGISINRNPYGVVKNNRIDISGNAGGATSITALNIDNSAYAVVSNNDLMYTTGGTNVTITGINITASSTIAKVKNNNINFTATLAGSTPFSYGTTVDAMRNLIDPAAVMAGSFTWTSGTASYVVSNSNVRTTSIIMVTPVNVGAGAVVRDLGYYITPNAGSFTIATAGGASTASASNWLYEIL